MNEHLRDAPVGVVAATSDGTVLAVNDAAAELLGSERPEGEPSIEETFPRSASGTLREAFADGAPGERSFEEYYPRIERWLRIDLVPAGERVHVYVRDRSPRHEDRRRIESLERRVARMEAIDELVGTVLRQIIDASGREEVSRTVVEGLGGTDLYEFAWLGERDLADDSLRVVASAGEAADLRARIADHLGADGSLPEQAAVADETTRVVQTIADDEGVPRPVRLAAFGGGLQSCIAVPLAYRDTVYGVLGVYAAREDGFSEAERSSLETLGAIAGFAIDASRREDILFADTVTELTLAVRDGTVPLVAAAGAADCRLVLSGAVPRESGSAVCYVRANGPVDAVVDAVSGREGVAAARVVDAEDGLFEVELTGATPVATLARRATVTAAEYGDGRARIVAEVPSDVDLRRLVRAVDAGVAETEVVSKAETARDPETVGAFRSDLEAALTDRQRQVLRTAYLSDYFESPRGSSSEEIAAALDVTGPTILYHLRRAQRKLLASFFGEDPETPADGEPGP